MFIIYTARHAIEARTKRLIKKRNRALSNRDYERVWILNIKINKSINQLISWCCQDIRV